MGHETPDRREEPGYQTYLVAFVVSGVNDQDRQEKLMAMLPPGDEGDLDCWWIAEDVRYDGSDNESAVFIPEGAKISQRHARLLLEVEARHITTKERR